MPDTTNENQNNPTNPGVFNSSFDVNGDGKIDSLDMSYAIEHGLNYDWNHDGKIDSLDVSYAIEQSNENQTSEENKEENKIDSLFDPNGDGKIDKNDLAYALEHDINYDINGDGQTDMNDVYYAIDENLANEHDLTAGQEYLLHNGGDINEDGKVDALDVAYAVKEGIDYDFNHDGKVDIRDAATLAQIQAEADSQKYDPRDINKDGNVDDKDKQYASENNLDYDWDGDGKINTKDKVLRMEYQSKHGDLNHDGKINSSDLAYAQRQGIKNADWNLDGVINSLDYTLKSRMDAAAKDKELAKYDSALKDAMTAYEKAAAEANKASKEVQRIKKALETATNVNRRQLEKELKAAEDKVKKATQKVFNASTKVTKLSKEAEKKKEEAAKKKELKVGDKVQIKDGGIDVTNGEVATKGVLYGEGGPCWATIQQIVPNWWTSQSAIDKGVEAQVTKVRCIGNDGETVVWQVRPIDIFGQIDTTKKADTAKTKKAVGGAKAEVVDPTAMSQFIQKLYTPNTIDLLITPSAYVPNSVSSMGWVGGLKSHTFDDVPGALYGESTPASGFISNSIFASNASSVNPYWQKVLGFKEIYKEQEARWFATEGKSNTPDRLINNMKFDKTIHPADLGDQDNIVQYESYRAEFLNNITGALGANIKDGRFKRFNEIFNGEASLVQNEYKYPRTLYSDDAYDDKTDGKDGTTYGIYAEGQGNLTNPNKNVTNADKAIWGKTWNTVKYEYLITPPSSKTKGPIKNLEDKLRDVRTAFGIPVHGNNDIAKSVKYYSYNRFKVPDTNLAFNRSFTHIFFTKPDLNILEFNKNSGRTAHKQCKNHTEAAMVWRRYPEIFYSLVDTKRLSDSGFYHNFNMLLSNQITSFNPNDETLATIKDGKTWLEHEMVYGDSFNGRTSGQFNCTFTETKNFDVQNMLRLWITYINNVSRGVWSPLDKHVHDRALDYASSMYMFIVGEDGESLLYWTKYYGVFPITNGANALGWQHGEENKGAPVYNIDFVYSFKKDMSPISLYEFNCAVNLDKYKDSDGKIKYVPAWDNKFACYNRADGIKNSDLYRGEEWDMNQTSRPFVATPYIEMRLGKPQFNVGGVNSGQSTELRLKFLRDANSFRSDKALFNNSPHNSKVDKNIYGK